MKKQRTEGTKRKDFLDVLLEFEGNGKDEPAKISDRDVIIFILEIFLAGSETSSSIVEWAMTELLRNPKSMSEVKDELARVVGADRNVEESDIDELQYLQAVVKETLRLHPPIPFLILRSAIQDTSFMGYHIPKDTQVLVNARAIGRDPGSWEDPSSFKPERFLDSKKIEYKGQNFELIPFGAGRRICAGIPLAHRVLHLVLGTLLHHFDWQLKGNVTPETMDMKEKWGLVMRKRMRPSQVRREEQGKPNIADFFPLLKRLDPLGMMRNMVRDMGQALNLIARFVNERDEERQSGMVREKRDFLDVLLECRDDEKEGPHEMSDNKVKIIVLEMFFAGSETTSSTLEWAMTELLRRPESMRKAQEELDRVVGPHGKVEESDIDQLLYLQAVVKETLRLHPPIPLLLPRNALQDTNFMGYFVPKNTQVFVNAWAIGRDPDAWKEPLSFKPDRFLGSNLDYKGQNFEFIPFGSGRRICIGISLANKLLPLALASLLHCFDWELGGGVTPETMDMNERVGITVRKLIPLKPIPKRRTV
ncbi:unnamed protein product, partial [Vitis vinifera]